MDVNKLRKQHEQSKNILNYRKEKSVSPDSELIHKEFLELFGIEAGKIRFNDRNPIGSFDSLEKV